MPREVNIRMWRMLLDKIPTKAKLRNRRVSMLSFECRLCGQEDETSDHIFGETR